MFTQEPQPLSPAQLQAFDRDGFLVLPKVLAPDACAALRDHADALATHLAARAGPRAPVFHSGQEAALERQFLASARGILAFFEPGGDPGGRRAVNKLGHALHALDPVFAPFSAHPAWHGWAQQLGVRRPKTCQSMLIFKQPGVGGAVQCHQDATYLHTTPANMLGLWMAFEDATVDNGCLWALPGGHRQGLKQRFVQRPEGGSALQVLDPTPFTGALQPLQVEAGSLVLLHALCPHQSSANHSRASRLAYTLHVIDADSAYAADNWLQDPL